MLSANSEQCNLSYPDEELLHKTTSNIILNGKSLNTFLLRLGEGKDVPSVMLFNTIWKVLASTIRQKLIN